jgi:hypothetical protein
LPRLRFDDLTFNFLPVEFCHRVSAAAPVLTIRRRRAPP